MSTDRIWLLLARKFSGEASPEELKELEEGLRENTELHFPVHAIEDLWYRKNTGSDEELEEVLHSHLKRMKEMGIGFEQADGHVEDDAFSIIGSDKRRTRRNILRYLSIALIGISVAGIFYFFSPKIIQDVPSARKERSISEVTTRNGSKTQVHLPDGTLVWLNAGSTLTYDKEFGQQLREVVLSGEGYFNVTKDSSRPFIIHTTHMDIRVLGTVFNVRSYATDRSSEAALIRGSIEVTLKDRPMEKLILKPNEKLVVSNEDVHDRITLKEKKKKGRNDDPLLKLSHLSYLEQDSTIIETSWVYNKLIFEDESFHDLANRLSRWYGVSFHFKDTAMEDLRFTGIFERESIREALVALKITGGFNYRINGSDITITQ